jgi:hypothetical protein
MTRHRLRGADGRLIRILVEGTALSLPNHEAHERITQMGTSHR